MAKLMTDEKYAQLCADERAARGVMDAAEKVWRRINTRVVKATNEREALKTDIESILTAYVGAEQGLRVENTAGYEALQALDRTELRQIGLAFMGGYYPATNQRVIKLMVNRDSPKETMTKTAAAIRKWAKYLKPGALANYDYGRAVKPSERDGWKAFEIFEYTLSEDGSYYLCQREDDVWVVARIRYSRWEYWEQKSLMDALLYVQKYHWYGTREDCY